MNKMIKLKVLDTLSVDDGRTLVALQGASSIYGYTYLVADDGKEHKIIGMATQSIYAYDHKIVDLVVKGDFNYTEANLV